MVLITYKSIARSRRAAFAEELASSIIATIELIVRENKSLVWCRPVYKTDLYSNSLYFKICCRLKSERVSPAPVIICLGNTPMR